MGTTAADDHDDAPEPVTLSASMKNRQLSLIWSHLQLHQQHQYQQPSPSDEHHGGDKDDENVGSRLALRRLVSTVGSVSSGHHYRSSSNVVVAGGGDNDVERISIALSQITGPLQRPDIFYTGSVVSLPVPIEDVASVIRQVGSFYLMMSSFCGTPPTTNHY